VQWQQVRDIFERDLNSSTVFRMGESDGSWLVGGIDVFIVGFTAQGDLVGVYTVSIET